MRALVEGSEQPRVDVKAKRLSGAGCELDLAKAHQALGRFPPARSW